jgi:hypothetical protein
MNKTVAEDKARRKLVKAQRLLDAADEEYVQARERGRQEVEKARLRAAKWRAKASSRREKWAQRVAKAEARLLELTAGEGAAGIAAPSPEAAADIVEERAAERAAELDESPILIPDGAASDGAIRDRERRALEALQTYGPTGATATEWRRTAQMAESTFGRARTALVTRGLVRVDGEPGRGARYVLAEMARA